MSLKTVITAAAGGVLSKAGQTILKSLGLGLVTSTITLTLINKYIDYAKNSFGALGDAMGILSIAGFNVALSIIFSALVIRVTLNSKKVMLRALK